LTQEVQLLKDDIDKREQENHKLKTLINSPSQNSSLNNTTIVPINQQMQPQAPPNLNLNSVLNAMIHTTSPITNMAQNMMNSSTYSLSQQQHNMPNDEQFNDENYLENWLSIPTKRNIKKHGWKKLYVVLKKSKLLFYNSLRDKDSQEPYMVIDLEFVCLVIFTWLVFGSIREICFHQKESLSCKSSDTDRCGASGHT
jgi:hypothetical protein